MPIENQKQFIIQQRAQGVPDDQIFDTIQRQNKPAEQRSFAGELLPTAFSIGGGVLGGIVGAPAAGVGAIPGSIAGAAAGGALGESIQQGIEKRFGQREEISAPQIAATGALSGAFQAAGVGVAKGVGAVGRIVIPKVRTGMTSFFKSLSGFNDEVITKALERSPGAVEGLKGGEATLNTVVKKSIVGLNQLAKRFVTESKEALNSIVKDTPLPKTLLSPSQKFRGVRTKIFNRVGDFINTSIGKLRTNHNIGVNKNGVLNFLRGNQPSRIVSSSEQSAVQQAFTLMKSVRNNLSLKHVDSIFERMTVLKSKTPTGTPTGTETRAVISSLTDDLMRFVEKVYPKSYTDLLKSNLQKRVFISEAKELLGSSRFPSPKEVSLAEGRILQLFNTGKFETRAFFESLGQELGEDIVGTSAGTLLKTGGQVSARATNLTARGVVEKVFEAIPRKALTNFIKTGRLTGDLLKNRIVINAAKTLNISTRALLLEVANLSTEKTVR